MTEHVAPSEAQTGRANHASRTGWPLTCAMAGILGLVVFQYSPAAQGPAGSPGPPGGFPPDFAAMLQERPLVRQFDKTGDRRLDGTERKAAREWLASQAPAGLAGLMGRFGPPPPGGMAALLGGRGFAPSAPGRRLAPADVRSYATESLYDTATLRTLFMQFESPEWEKELADFYNTDVEVPARVTVDGKTYPDVGVHFRGMSSFMFASEGSKRSLNLAFDFVDNDQRLLGYRTLNLLNGNGDPTLVRGLLYSEIARHYIPTPKMNYVRAVINGENWGVYVNAQQFNADFVNEWFSTRRGARWRVPGSPFGQGGMAYLGENAAPYKSIYEIRTRDDEKSWTDLIRMFRVLNETPSDRLEAALAPMLDIDGTLKFLALEVALVNSDGYWVRASDYSIYQDEKGRFHIIPHDVNEALAEEGGGPGRGRGGPPPGFPPPGFQAPPGFPRAGGPPGFPGGGPPPGFPPGFQFPPMFGQAGVDLDPLVGLDDASKPLRSKLLAVPALRTRYLGYVREIAQRWLDWRTLEPLVRQYHSLIAEHVKADTRKLYTFEEFQAGVSGNEESVKSFADRRRAFLLKAQR